MPKKIRKDEPINMTSSSRKIRGDMKIYKEGKNG